MPKNEELAWQGATVGAGIFSAFSTGMGAPTRSSSDSTQRVPKSKLFARDSCNCGFCCLPHPFEKMLCILAIWNTIPAKRRRAGERTSTAGSRGPGPETPRREDDAGEVRAYDERLLSKSCRSEASHRQGEVTDACRDRIVQAIKKDPAEKDKYRRRKTLERHAGGGATQAQCRRGAHRRERREVPAVAASAQRKRSSRQAAPSRVRLRWRWMSTRERGPPRFQRSVGFVWP